MNGLIASSKMIAIVGTGVSGLSAARFLRRCNQRFVLFDTRQRPPNSELIEREFADVHCEFGDWDQSLLLSADEIVVSPGVPLSHEWLTQAREAGVPLVGDVDVFVRHARAPIVAITGSNAKSTVTTLVGEMARAAGLRVAIGGNLGTPALDLLDDTVELYVLELSSFQLEAVQKLGADVACILNLSPDHMDRYPNMPAYHAAKQRIYYGARHVVVNKRDVLTQPPLAADVTASSFGGAAEFKHMGTVEHEGQLWLADQLKPLIPVSELNIHGQHNIDNALAALAIGKAAGLPAIAMLEALREFRGLPHRCQPVGEVAGVRYINDSKGTNVGATVAAIEGLAASAEKLVVLLGGVAKDDNFSSLAEPLRCHARAVVVYGRDAGVIADSLKDLPHLQRVDSLEQAFERAKAEAQPGDVVLLSPACASFDEFENYQARGDAFCRLVEGAR